MDDWVKILITALSSFAVAMIAEPVRLAISEKRKLKQLREAVYRELAHNYVEVFSGLEDANYDPENEFNAREAMSRVSRSVFEYAQSQPELCYRLADIAAIERAHGLMATMAGTDNATWGELASYLIDIVIDDELDAVLLHSSASTYRKLNFKAGVAQYREKLEKLGAEFPPNRLVLSPIRRLRRFKQPFPP